VFNIGPLEFVVLALVGIVVLGPDRLPQFARDAARLLRTLRDLATGARQQLRDELGPEFADIDLASLNPRTAVQRAVFGDEVPDLRKYTPGNIVRDVIYGDSEQKAEPELPVDVDDDLTGPVSMTKSTPEGESQPSRASRPEPPARPASGTAAANGTRPRPQPRPRTVYDDDAT